MPRKNSVERICETCSKKFLAWPSRIKIGKGRFCSTSCGKRGSLNHSWNGGKRVASGYIRILKPDHPCADKNGYVAEHRLVMEEKLGRYLATNEHVHHINRNRNDNNPENLMLITPSEHARLHKIGNKDWLGKKHKPETIEKMKTAWANNQTRKDKQKKSYSGEGNPNYRHGKYVQT